MANLPKTFDGNPEDLKKFLEKNRQNGFLDLQDQHKQFAQEFLRCYSHLQAADAAQIPRSIAMRVLNDPLVQCFLTYLREKKETYTLIDTAFVESQYLSLYGKLIGEEEVPMVDKDGVCFQGKKFHASEAVSALRDMAKSTKFFKEGGGSGGVNINFDLGALGIKQATNQPIEVKAEVVSKDSDAVDAEYTDV